MSRHASVTFRGEEHDVIIDSAHYDPETNAGEIEWHFQDVTPEAHEVLAITADEELSICQQIATYLDERSGD